MALIMSGIVPRLAQFSNRVIGSILERWRSNPQLVFADFYLLFSVVSSRLEYTPYSNKTNIVLSSDRMKNTWNDITWQHHLLERERGLLDPDSPEVTRVLRVLVRIVQALSDGLRLQHDCTVSAPKYVAAKGSGGDIDTLPGKSELVLSGIQWGCFDNTRKLGGLECNIEHLDGLNWELVVGKTEEYSNVYHFPIGRVAMDTAMLDSFGSEEELAFVLAHEVGHGVAMHPPGLDPLRALCVSAQIPWLSGIWGPAIFLRIWDLILHRSRRRELEADYIGLMLMASAGYDPELAPQFFERRKYCDDYDLATTHPSYGLRVQMMSRSMDKAVELYEQVRVSHEVPSFIHRFENQIGPAGSTGTIMNRSSHRSIPLHKNIWRKIWSKLIEPMNRSQFEWSQPTYTT